MINTSFALPPFSSTHKSYNKDAIKFMQGMFKAPQKQFGNFSFFKSNELDSTQQMAQNIAKLQFPSAPKIKSVPLSFAFAILKTNNEPIIAKCKEIPIQQNGFLQRLSDPLDLKNRFYGKLWTHI